jgi:uncharacterized membrane protein
VVEATSGACRQAPHPVVGLGVSTFAFPVDHRIVVRGVGPGLFAALLCAVIGELRVRRTESGNRFLVTYLLLAAFMVDLEFIKGVKGRC